MAEKSFVHTRDILDWFLTAWTLYIADWGPPVYLNLLSIRPQHHQTLPLAVSRQWEFLNSYLLHFLLDPSEGVLSKVSDLSPYLQIFAGPKRGRPTWGFPDFVRAYVRTCVSTLDFSFILHAQFTSDPQYFYRFRTSYVLTIRGADHRFPRPP